MAKRFGRNQRRKMREEIAAANEWADYWQHWAEQYRHNAVVLRGRLNRWADDVRSLMGADSAFNEQISRVRSDPWGPTIRLNPQSHCVATMPFAPVEAIEAQRVIEALIYRLDVKRDNYSEMVRIELVNEREETIAYAVSERHFWTEKDEEVLTRMIAGEITRFKNERIRSAT